MKYKTWFIDVYVSAMIASLLHAFWMLWSGSGESAAWWAVVVGVSPGLLFFGRVYAYPIARTSALMWPAFRGHGLGLAMLSASGSHEVWAWAETLLAGLVGSVIYQLWYSHFGRLPSAALGLGQRLPALSFDSADGRPVRTKDIQAPGRARGANLADQLAPHDNTAQLAHRHQVPFHFLVDRDNAVARQLGIVALDGTSTSLRVLGYDGDTAMPTVVLSDHSQRILFCDETDNYRVRPKPEVFLKLLDGILLAA